VKAYDVGHAPAFLASKWQHVQLLISPHEMEKLMADFNGALFFSMLGPTAKNSFSMSEFLDVYKGYIKALLLGPVADDPFRFYFTSIITIDPDAVAEVILKDSRRLIQPLEPLLQMRPHKFDYSPIDGVFRPMVNGQKSISWGVQISYPQLFQDADTRVVYNALEHKFKNLTLFRALQSFIRRETLPTPFIVHNTLTNVPMRLGKECFSWINGHQELVIQNIQVRNYTQ